jgi:F-type H+-transporting ATPase subunit delta
MKTTRQTRREAKQLFRLCLVNGLVDADRVRQVVQRVIDGKRRGYLALLSQFQRLVKLESDRHTAEIESAVPLGTDLRDRINTDLEHLYGPGLHTRFVHRPELIAGVRVSVGSDVYDGSVQYRLTELRKSFSITGGNGKSR